MDSELIGKLQKLGFTENEAKTYVGLLSLNEATAREIHELTHVPRPKVYGVLDRMAKKGYVEIREGTPAYFRGVDPELLTERLRNEFLFSLNETLKELNSAGNGMRNRCC
ncbi:TrmB family transcriptional regulator [Methanosarcina sp. KYL-1]|uniref:TrmB family transcriptional regulator n=1 Tax=Methanosarcina sp. KYL-1 TaxID=2602068 RepID=UPI002101A15C|nr:helix-turn-helix domain-containing protein [Methanosarcina sp. KYL-1]MCQ1536240.1 TrmB family transcriptional regulator [Methanosarcina sp. KYL-1]